MTFDLQIEAPHADPEELEILTLQLRRALLDLDGDVAVNLAAGGGLPPGSKGVDPSALGALVVTIAQSSGLAALIHAVQGWLSASNRTVRIQVAGGDSLEVVGVSSADQRRLIDAWIDSHAGH